MSYATCSNHKIQKNMEKEILLMENIEKLELLNQAKRLMENVVSASFDQIGRGNQFWFAHLSTSLGALSVAIQKLEKENG